MSKRKLEVVELNKKEEKIILEEEQSRWTLFCKKYNRLIFLILLILSLALTITSIIITISNLSISDKPTIKEVSIDLDINNSGIIIDPSSSLTDETAKNTFNSNGDFKTSGEVLLVKTVKHSKYTIKFYSDYTALKIMKNSNYITRIDSINGTNYGIKENGVINIKAKIADIKKTNTQKFPWGTVNYYSDGSADIVNSKIDMFVRKSKDINENYISNNKVAYLKETKNVGKYKINYYYDNTIQIIDDSKTYIVRNEEDFNIKHDNINFSNSNQATIKETKNLKDGNKIEYYTDGSAIIYDGSKTISVRKSNSIIIKDNKIYEIVDNIYVTISKTTDNGNVINYTNGGAVVKNYNGKTVYVPENSNIKFNNGKVVKIDGDYEQLVEEKNINGDKIKKFENTAVVEKDGYIAIVPENNLIFNSDGSLKEILDNEISSLDKPIKITNNTNDTIKYRLVLEKSNRTTLDVQYIRYQLSVGNTYVEPRRLDSEIWKTDAISNSLSVTGINYILVEKELEPHQTDEVKVMLWTDYETIPNEMQNTYFYGTIRVYSWKEIKNNNL